MQIWEYQFDTRMIVKESQPFDSSPTEVTGGIEIMLELSFRTNPNVK